MISAPGLPDSLRPDWPAPPTVTALMSTRAGGVSSAPFDSLNLRSPELGGEGVDATDAVRENQRRFAQALGARPVWLAQVHGTRVVQLQPADLLPGRPLHRADASVSTTPGLACVVQVADCLPVLLSAANGKGVAAAHAGWRGLAGGIVEATVAALCEAAGCGPQAVIAWLGPCIGPQAFEVGADVLLAFGADPTQPDTARFVPRPRADGSPRWLANLPQLARDRLAAVGVGQVSGGRWCTVADASRFFSFRREPRTGRLAAAVSLRG